MANGSPERTSSEPASQEGETAFQHPTAKIGGVDIDGARPVKFSRLSLDPEQGFNDVADAEDYLEGEQEDDDGEGLDTDRSEASFQSADQNLLEDFRDVGDELEREDETNDAVSEIAQETIEAEIADQVPLRATPIKMKRPKGWHLRKENRHLRQALLQGSPIRSERQDSIDTQEINGYEPAVILRRLPGRRRLPHADPEIEADMRRQLELKIAYRAVVKALKPVLIELAERTETQIGSEEEKHKDNDSYNDVVRELGRRFQSRLEIIDNQFHTEETRLERQRATQLELREQEYALKSVDLLEDAIAGCQYRYMELMRQSQQAQEDEATDDEDGIISRPCGQDREAGTRLYLDQKHDSRCRWFLSNAAMWADLDDRHRMAMEQKAHFPGSLECCPKGFAVYDGQLRKETSAHLNLLTLLDADEELRNEGLRRVNRITNEDALGLQTLATAMGIGEAFKCSTSIHASSTPTTDTARAIFSAVTQPYPAIPEPSVLKEYDAPQNGWFEDDRARSYPIKQEEGLTNYTGNNQQPFSASPRQTPSEPPSLSSHGFAALDTKARYKPPEEHKSRRKAFTFDLIMHQPEDEAQDDQSEPSHAPAPHASTERARPAYLTPSSQSYDDSKRPHTQMANPKIDAPAPRHGTPPLSQPHESVYPPHPMQPPTGPPPRAPSMGNYASRAPTRSRPSSPASSDHFHRHELAYSQPTTPASKNSLPWMTNEGWQSARPSLAPKTTANSYSERTHAPQATSVVLPPPPPPPLMQSSPRYHAVGEDARFYDLPPQSHARHRSSDYRYGYVEVSGYSPLMSSSALAERNCTIVVR